MAAQEGHLECLRELVKAGANVDQANKKGVTPLNISADEGHLEVVRALLEMGADKSPVDAYVQVSYRYRTDVTDPLPSLSGPCPRECPASFACKAV